MLCARWTPTKRSFRIQERWPLFSESFSSSTQHQDLIRYARQIRAMSNEFTADDPPTAPLPETHELDQGDSDFSNFLDKHYDTSDRMAWTGLAIGFGFFASVAWMAAQVNERRRPPYVPRNLPYWKSNIDGVTSSEHE